MNFKKILSTALVAISLISTIAISASADTLNNDDSTIETINGSELSADKIEELQSNGIDIDSDSIISLSSFDTDTRSTTSDNYITITNDIGNDEIKTDIYLYLDEYGDTESIVDQNVQTRGSNTITSPLGTWDGRYTLKGTALYSVYGGAYYRPLSASFIYTKNSTCTVSEINMIYNCNGVIYDYPSYDCTDEFEYYSISVNKSSPTAGITYSNYDPRSSDTVLRTSSGGLGAGHYISFEITVDGTTSENSVSFYPQT
ncbi:MAG: hypothetical protein R3Y33_06870 [Clostridia bacterium]